MAIPTTALHILRLLLQVDQNLSGLQADMRNNALAWKAAANEAVAAATALANDPTNTANQQRSATAISVQLLAQWMNAAAVEYQKRLGWITAAQADTTNWTALSTMWAKLGGTGTDFNNTVNPMKAVADQLGPAAKATYADIIAACDQIISAINAPLSLWPE